MTSEKAPDRLYSWPSNISGWNYPYTKNEPVIDCVTYIRSDVADAMVAERELALVLAAYEAAADFVEGWLDGSLDPSNMRLLHGDICSIPSADARAALAEAERKAWNAAIEAALTTYDAEWRENTATKRAAIAALKKETQG